MKAAKRFKTQERERERSQVGKEKNLRKIKQAKCFEEQIIDALFKSNINTIVEKHFIRNFTC